MCRCRSPRWRTPLRNPCCRSYGPGMPARGRTRGFRGSPRRSPAGSSVLSSASRASGPYPHKRFRSSGPRHRPAPPAAPYRGTPRRPRPAGGNSESWRACRSSRAARASVRGARRPRRPPQGESGPSGTFFSYSSALFFFMDEDLPKVQIIPIFTNRTL